MMTDEKSIRTLVGWSDFLPMLTSHITSMGKRVADAPKLWRRSVAHPTLLMACALMLAGCARQQQYETIEQICVPDMDKAEAIPIYIGIAEDVLVKMHFTIDKADVDSGIIITNPLPGAQFFEFWRSDNVGAFNTMEANLQSIRRTAQLNIRDSEHVTRGTSDGKFYISCDVQVQRLSMPEPQQLHRTPGQLTQITVAEWIDLGKDTQLATEILKRIEQRIRNRDNRAATVRERTGSLSSNEL